MMIKENKQQNNMFQLQGLLIVEELWRQVTLPKGETVFCFYWFLFIYKHSGKELKNIQWNWNHREKIIITCSLFLVRTQINALV